MIIIIFSLLIREEKGNEDEEAMSQADEVVTTLWRYAAGGLLDIGVTSLVSCI